MAENIIDVAIIGAGCAGLYSAHRLTNTEPEVWPNLTSGSSRKPVVDLFEASPRLGGRLLSISMPGMSELPFNAELGGMRFTRNHLLLYNLINVLKRPKKSFKYDTRVMYLRGRHWTKDNIKVSEARCDACGIVQGLPLYQLRQDETVDPSHFETLPEQLALLAIMRALKEITFKYTTDPFLNEAMEEIHDILQDLDETRRPVRLDKRLLTTKQWDILQRHAIIQERHLYDLGFWNLMQHFLSSEAFLLVHNGLGYESIWTNWNAAEAIPWFLADFGDTTYWTLEKGMADFPLTLFADAFDGPSDPAFHRNHELTSIEMSNEDGEHLLKLTFRAGERTKEPKEFWARHVILAMPKEALRAIEFKLDDPAGPIRTQTELKQVLETAVNAHPLFKLFLGYERAWWADPRALGTLSGKSITDLPIRQVYYFGGEHDRGMVMASYSDEHYVDFWRPLKKTGVQKPYYLGDPEKLCKKDKNILEVWGAIKPMVLKAHRQVKALHPNLPYVPDPYVAVVKDWMEPPFCGGWHSWNVHTQAWDVIKKLTRPFGNINLYICGEAYSREQGWVEGALKSAELVMRHLGLPAPTWVNSKEYTDRCYTGYDEYIES